MGEYAALGGDFITSDEPVQQIVEAGYVFQAVRGGVDADDRIARTVVQAVNGRGQDAAGVVRGVVGLQPDRKMAGQADGIPKAG